jgi:hypothetical protein
LNPDAANFVIEPVKCAAASKNDAARGSPPPEETLTPCKVTSTLIPSDAKSEGFSIEHKFKSEYRLRRDIPFYTPTFSLYRLITSLKNSGEERLNWAKIATCSKPEHSVLGA